MAVEFKPYRARAIAFFNGLCRLLGVKFSLAPENLLEAARRKTGLTDFGTPAVDTHLAVLCKAIDEEAQLHPFGRWVIRTRLIGIMVTRLRVQALLKQHPEIHNLPISPPLVIAGLQRTGTTMLHRLLAADPATRALESWEAINPMPHPKEIPGQPTWRIKQATLAEKGLKYLAPEFFAIHPVEATAPEEDVLLLEYSLLSQVPPATLWIPSYLEYLQGQDMEPAYTCLKTLLQVLQWQNPGQRWVLKTPAHLEHLDVLLRVFPEAKIIQTHRDPQRITASFSSMLAHGYGVFADTVDAAAVARTWLNNNASMVDAAWTVRQSKPEAFLDVAYADLMQDPMTQVQRIYDFAGLELDEAARAAMQASQQRNRKDRHGKHSYSLEEFGLSAQDVNTAYANYLTHFDIPKEHAR